MDEKDKKALVVVGDAPETALEALKKAPLKTPEEFNGIITAVRNAIPKILKDTVIAKISQNVFDVFAQAIQNNKNTKQEEKPRKASWGTGICGGIAFSPGSEKTESGLTFETLVDINWFPPEIVIYLADEIEQLLKSINSLIKITQDEIENDEEVDMEAVNAKILKRIKNFFEKNWDTILNIIFLKNLGANTASKIFKAIEDGANSSVSQGKIYTPYLIKRNKRKREDK